MQQMIWGGREHQLQCLRLLEVLPALVELGLIEPAQIEALIAGYRFLRDTEHSLQAEADRQTQQLPASSEGRLRLAIGRGYPDYDSFLEALDDHRAGIRRVFADLLGAQPEGEDDATALWRDPRDEARLRGFGFVDTDAIGSLLEGLVSGPGSPLGECQRAHPTGPADAAAV